MGRGDPRPAKAAFRLMRAAAKPMMKARFWRIVTITGVVWHDRQPRTESTMPPPRQGWWGCRRASGRELASRGVTRQLRLPGFIATAMTEVLPDAQKDALSAPFDGPDGRGRDIGAAVAYLASRGRGYVTGQTLRERRDGDGLRAMSDPLATPADYRASLNGRLRPDQPSFDCLCGR